MGPFALIRTSEQWLRAAHHGTALDRRLGEVSLGWLAEEDGAEDPPRAGAAIARDEAASPRAGDASPRAGDASARAGDASARAGDAAQALAAGRGLAFDSAMRLYSLYGEAGVRRERWRQAGSAAADAAQAEAVEVLDLFAQAQPTARLGDFRPASVQGPPHLVDLAIDAQDQLYLAGTDQGGGGRIWIFDLPGRAPLRDVALPAPPRALAVHGDLVVCLAGDALLRLSARRGPGLVSGFDLTAVAAAALAATADRAPDPAAATALAQGVTRMAVAPDGAVHVLLAAGSEHALVVPVERPAAALAIPGATDLLFVIDEAPLATLVVARGAGRDLLRFDATDHDGRRPLRAYGHRGDGIVRTPDNRVGYRGAAGFRHAFTAPLRYRRQGHVVSFRLDSGEFQTTWGRVLIDAAVPEGAEIRVRCLCGDEPGGEGLPWNPPSNLDARDGAGADLDPSLPPRSWVDEPLRTMLSAASAGADSAAEDPSSEEALRALFAPLYRRGGAASPWAGPAAGEPVATFEAPVRAGPGRYLWVILQLSGTTRVTPRVRAVRVEFPGHDLLARLPRVFSRDAAAASFLQRYLGVVAGFTEELARRADERHVLLSPRAAPAEILPWLASLVGVTLDEKWSEAQQRRLLAEAAALHRERGTIAGLRRLVSIYTGGPVRVIEDFDLRGGSALLGDPRGAIVGAGLQVGPPRSDRDPCRAHAHRATVVVLTALSREGELAVEQLVAAHRPAHVQVELCLVRSGLRVGIGARVGMTTLVGRGSGFLPLRTGESTLGRDRLVGPGRAIAAVPRERR